METSQTISPARSRSLALPWPALGLFFFGLAIVYCVGFSDLPRAHNAAHDTRHAAGFPCH
jgi:cobalt transporter subunit CbtB